MTEELETNRTEPEAFIEQIIADSRRHFDLEHEPLEKDEQPTTDR